MWKVDGCGKWMWKVEGGAVPDLTQVRPSVGTCVNYGRIFIDHFTANLLQSVRVKEF